MVLISYPEDRTIMTSGYFTLLTGCQLTGISLFKYKEIYFRIMAHFPSANIKPIIEHCINTHWILFWLRKNIDPFLLSIENVSNSLFVSIESELLETLMQTKA